MAIQILCLPVYSVSPSIIVITSPESENYFVALTAQSLKRIRYDGQSQKTIPHMPQAKRMPSMHAKQRTEPEVKKEEWFGQLCEWEMR